MVTEPKVVPEVVPVLPARRDIPDPEKTLAPDKLCPAQRRTITRDV